MGDRLSKDSKPAPVMIQIDPQAIDHVALRPAAQALASGALVAFPTETVYGLGANALSADAISRIYRAKGRPTSNPLIVHIARLEDIESIVTEFPPHAQKLAETFWPGPLTLILPRKNTVPGTVSAGLPTVAVRMPAHPIARALISLAKCPIAAPSANRYTELSPTRAEHVRDGLGARVDYIIDGGPTSVGLESTVLSLIDTHPIILRPGMITREEIAAILPDVIYADDAQLDDTTKRPSPGMARRHYSPRATLQVVDTTQELLSALKPSSPEFKLAQNPVGVLLHTPGDPQILAEIAEQTPTDAIIILSDSPQDYAHDLYDALHRLDQLNCARILVQRPPSGDAWRAIHDRLARAAD